jgi:hypothetical protein
VFSTAPRIARLGTDDRRRTGAAAKLQNLDTAPAFPPAACELLASLHRALDGYPDPRGGNDDLAAVEFFAPNLFILTGEKRGSPVYQLAGSAIQRHLGCNPADQDYCGFFEPQARAELMRHFHSADASRRAFTVSSSLRSQGSILLLSTLLLPVTADDPGKIRFIGLCLAEYRPATGPDTGTSRQQLRRIAFVQAEQQARTRASNL